MARDNGDKVLGVQLSQERHLGAVGHRSPPPNEHRRSGTK